MVEKQVPSESTEASTTANADTESHEIDYGKAALEGKSSEDLGLAGTKARDYKILQMRLTGATLDAVGEKFELTRERVRQISMSISRKQEKALREEVIAREGTRKRHLAEIIEEYVTEHPGIEYQELSKQFGQSVAEIRNLIANSIGYLVRDPLEEKTGTVLWTNDQIIESIQKAGTYHFPLSKSQYDDLIAVKEIIGPSSALIWKRFGSWTEACFQAGVESNQSHGQYQTLWNRAELINYVARFIKATRSRTIASYIEWRKTQLDRVPSDQLIRIEFGNWNIPVYEALTLMRKSWENEQA